MRTDNFRDFFEYLGAPSGEKPVLLVTHERPDGDAVASLTAMYHLLTENGYAAEWFIHDSVPDAYLDFLPSSGRAHPASAREIGERFRAVFNTDASTVKRLGIAPCVFEQIAVPFLTLDHHPDNELFGTLSYVDPAASSASEIVFRFAKDASWRISKDAATALLLGVTTDSGCFRFSNTTPRALRCAAELMELGADHGKVIDRAYLSKPFNMAMFEAELFRSCLRTALDGKYVWITIPPDLMKRYSIDIRNTEQLIELIRAVQGVEVAALIKYTESPGIWKISLRSKNPRISAGRIARRLNGGGHEMAAGGTIFAKDLEDAENILLKHVEQEYQNETQSGKTQTPALQ